MKNGVVIVTYNRLSLLRECVSCVLGQTVPFSHVIIVDNCSTDGTGDYLGNLKAEAEAGGQDSAKPEINDPGSQLSVSGKTSAEPAVFMRESGWPRI